MHTLNTVAAAANQANTAVINTDPIIGGLMFAGIAIIGLIVAAVFVARMF